MSAVKVLIVDDSPVVREQALALLRTEPDIEVLGIADSKETASEKLATLKPDVITICLKSKLNVGEFVKAIVSQTTIPVVVITEIDVGHLGLEKTGAVTFVKMPLIRTASSMAAFNQRVLQQIKESAKTRSKPSAPTAPTAQATPFKAASEPSPQVKKEPPKPGPGVNETSGFGAKAPEPTPKAEFHSTPEAKPTPAPPPKPTPTPVAKPAPASAPKPAEPTVTAAAEANTKPAAKPVQEASPKPATKPVQEASPKPAEAAKPIDQNDPAARAIAAASAAKQRLGSSSPSPTLKGRHHVIALGASTGGTDALHTVLQDLPVNTPGIVIVQHMPELFTKMYADRLNRVCKMSCVEAVDGERVEVGKIILAAGNYHLRLAKDVKGYYVTSQRGEKVSGHCPSVDVLFESVAKVAGSDAIGAIFTGMGADGAIGLKKMRDAGAFTIGQDEKTSVVYGMPMVAYNMGGVCVQAPLEKISNIILENC